MNARKQRKAAAKEQRIKEASVRDSLGFSRERWKTFSQAHKEEILVRFETKVKEEEAQAVSP